MRIVETKVYQFEELSETAQEKAVEEMADINVEFGDWHTWALEDTAEQWEEKFGIIFDPKRTYFDFDRAFWIAFEDIYVDDHKKAYRALGMSHGEKLALTRDDMRFCFTTNHHAYGQMSNTLEIVDYRDSTAPALTVDVDQWFTEICQTLLYDLRKEYKSLTSREAIVETIKINEYEFSANGKF